MSEIKILDDKYIMDHDFTREDLDKFVREHLLMKNHNMETSTNLENIIRIKIEQHHVGLQKVLKSINAIGILNLKFVYSEELLSYYGNLLAKLDESYAIFNKCNETFFIYDEYANELDLRMYSMWALLVKETTYIQDLFNMSYDLIRFAIKTADE